MAVAGRRHALLRYRVERAQNISVQHNEGWEVWGFRCMVFSGRLLGWSPRATVARTVLRAVAGVQTSIAVERFQHVMLAQDRRAPSWKKCANANIPQNLGGVNYFASGGLRGGPLGALMGRLGSLLRCLEAIRGRPGAL